MKYVEISGHPDGDRHIRYLFRVDENDVIDAAFNRQGPFGKVVSYCKPNKKLDKEWKGKTVEDIVGYTETYGLQIYFW